MPVINISKISQRTKTSKAGKKYSVKTIEGTKYGSEDEWSVDVFLNQTDLLEQLDEFSPGELVNVKFKKNGNFYDVVGFEEPDAEMLEKIDSGEYAAPAKKTTGGKSFAGGGKKQNSSMSKEEWAAKDKATKESIARAVAVKLAMDNTKIGTKADAILNHAMEFLPFLMGEDEILFETADSPEDPLNPPIED